MADKSLIINAPSQGIALSPHIGFGDVRNLDIHSIPGIVRLNNILMKKSSTTVTGLIKWMVRNPVTPAQIYALDDTGVVYLSTDTGLTWAVLGGNTLTGGFGQGLTIWKDYLFVTRSTGIDLYGPLSSSPAWRNTWAGLTMDSDTAWHPLLVSKLNGDLFGGAANYIFRIAEVVGKTFLWSDATTYTATTRALTLANGYRVKCLEELGNNLMVGTWKGTTITDFRVADIFTWDMSSVTYGQPINIGENGVSAMLTVGNTLYVMAGVEGRIYRSDGVSAVTICQLPSSVINIEGGLYVEPFPDAFKYYKGRLFFGVSTGGTGNTANMGIYSLMQTSKGNVLTLEHTISSGNDGTSAPLKVGSILSVARDQILVGWQDTTFGIDLTATTIRQLAYTAYFVSPFYNVGTNLNPRVFQEIDILLAKPLVTGEGFKLEYRKNLTDSFTTIGTYDFDTIGGKLTHHIAASIPSCEFVQLRVSLNGFYTTPQLKNIIVS